VRRRPGLFRPFGPRLHPGCVILPTAIARWGPPQAVCSGSLQLFWVPAIRRYRLWRKPLHVFLAQSGRFCLRSCGRGGFDGLHRVNRRGTRSFPAQLAHGFAAPIRQLTRRSLCFGVLVQNHGGVVVFSQGAYRVLELFRRSTARTSAL